MEDERKGKDAAWLLTHPRELCKHCMDWHECSDADASQQLDSDCPNEPILWDEINANNIHDRMVEKWKNEIKKVRVEIAKTYKHEE